MSNISSVFGRLPGMGTPIETFESAVTWGPWPPRYWKNAYISSAAVDSGNSPTTTLRMGLVMGKITSSGQWTNYSPTATDGSQVAQGILAENLRLLAVDLSGTTQARFYAILASGGVQASKLFGLDNQARAQLRNFIFDDNIVGNSSFDWINFQAKTANYTILSTDNLSLFTNAGAGGSVTFTLPAIANGYEFGFRVVADQTVTITSAEGGNIVAFNNAAATSVAFSTGGQRIGGGVTIFSNNAGTLWFVENTSAGTNTITVA